MESMKAGDLTNWSLNPEQFADLASSLNNFFSSVKPDNSQQHTQPVHPQQAAPAPQTPFSTSQSSHTSNISGQ
jgi:hypothetical protein